MTGPVARRAALTGCLAACLAGPAWAGELAGVTLPERATAGPAALVLNGMGLREATWLRVDVYVAGLYLETKSTDADAVVRAERPKRLVFVFVRAASRRRILEEWDESLRAVVGDRRGALEDRIALLRSWMPTAVREGDDMSLTYLPGEGVVVVIKGTTRGTIPGPDFARALFGIWLGARPPNPSLKMGLLGRE